MEPIKQTVFRLTEKSEQQQTSSTTGTTQNTTYRIDAKAAQILGQIIDRSRIAKGWNPYEDEAQDLAIQTWFEVLTAEKVPYQHFDELYRRACVQQVKALAMGREPLEMTPQLIAAQWNNYRLEIETARIESKRYLPESAESSCQHCYGTGFRRHYEFDKFNRKIPGVVRCYHPGGEVIYKL